MIKTIKKVFNVASAVVIGSTLLMNCEPEVDSLGSQFFSGADIVDGKYPLIAYNIDNHDTIRTDAAKLDSAVIGAFNEPQFGLQKVGYVSQARLSSYDPDFGTNPVLDSAVMLIKPAYITDADSIVTHTNENYIFNDNDNINVEAKKEVSLYKIKKYGKTKIAGNVPDLTLKVERVSDFLESSSTKVYSNKNVATSTVLGQKVIKNGLISSVKITKKSDNSELLNRAASIRLNLDSLTFQNDIIKKAKMPELADAASFIRFFKGIKVSVIENDGYLFKITPSEVSVMLYYKNDLEVPNGTPKRVQRVFPLSMSVGTAKFSQITYDRFGTPSANLVGDQVNGDPKLYLQGMGGPGAGFKIPNATLTALKNKFKNDKIGIINARIRVYTDPTTWTTYGKPNYFVVKQSGLNTYLKDMTALAATGVYNFLKVYDTNRNPTYYDIGVTQTIKNMVEKEEQYRDFIFNVGKYTFNSSGMLAGLSSTDNQQNYNTRSYTQQRGVFVGSISNSTDPLYEMTPKLLITYGQKNN